MMQHEPFSQFNQKRSDIELTHTETTRYLCAAAHLDENFCSYIMEQIVEEEHRAVGELYGADIVPIVKWCISTRQRTLARNIFLFGLLLIAIIVGIQLIGSRPVYSYDYGYIYTVSPSFWAFLVLVPLLLIVLSLLSAIPSPILLILYVLVIFFAYPMALFFLGAWLIVGIEMGVRYYGSRAQQLSRNSFRTDAIQVPLEPSLEQKLRAGTQNGNTVVYSGYSPFVGAGLNIGGWSFAVDISKGKMKEGVQLRPIPFRASELYNYVTERVRRLGLNNLFMEDKLYVNGQEIRDDRRFLPQPLARPFQRIPSEMMWQFIEPETPSQDIRHYKCIRVTSWRGELILSLFIRFVRVGKNFFIEADYFLLPPLKNEYYGIDTIEPTLTFRKVRQLAVASLLATVGLWFRSPVKIFFSTFHHWILARRHKRIERQIMGNPAFDYGAASSLREVASSTGYRRHFQRLDKEMYVKIIEGELLESIITFLDDKNVDTTDLKQRQETILNNGVIVSGGSFHAENVAVGERAKAVLSNLTESSRGMMPGGNTTNDKQQTTKS
jgi:hypothetical protein